MGWYCYLQNTMKFPFNAKVINHIKTAPLNVGDIVEVIDMADDDVCEHEMMVNIKLNDDELAIPLKKIAAIDADNKTSEAIDDWHIGQSDITAS